MFKFSRGVTNISEAKYYKPKSLRIVLYEIDKLVVGLIVLVLAALLLANGVLMIIDPNSQIFGQDAVNIIVAFVLVVLAGSYFNEAKE